jgi:hypothetical protein
MNARVVACLCASVLAAGTASPAFALANRVFVSARTGNNLNSCDNIGTPCQTLQGAIAQLNPDGQAIVLDSGGYGPMTITQGVTVEAPAGVTAFIHPPAGDAITVNAAGANVTLRGLTLNVGSGNGIAVTAVGVLNVERCVISGFSNGINVTTSARIALVDSAIKGSTTTGINATNGAQLDIAGSRFQDNALGLSAHAVTASVRVAIRETSFIGNGEGIDVEANSGRVSAVDISHSLFSHNGIAIRPSNNFGSAPVRLAFSTVTANSIGVQPVNSGTFFTQGNNLIRENTTADIQTLTGGTSTTVAGD